MLASVEDVKLKLEIPASDTSRDEGILSVAEAVSDYVLDRCRYLEEAEVGHVETLRHIYSGRWVWLDKRPITGTPTVQGRGLGNVEYFDLGFDLVDAERGIVVITGSDGFGSWPPTAPGSSYANWRRNQWPIVRVTYDVSGQGSEDDAPADLRDVTAAYAAYLYDRHISGAKKTLSVGQIRQEIMTEGEPAWIRTALRKHLDGGHAKWV